MRLNPTRLIDLKMKLNFYKVKRLRLYSNLSLMINHRKIFEILYDQHESR